MRKLTRCLKKNKKNRTLKTGGAGVFFENPENFESTQGSPKKERQGIIDVIQNNISNTASFVGDVGLQIIGLQRIGKSKQEDFNKKVLGAVSGAVSAVDRSASAIERIGANIAGNVSGVVEGAVEGAFSGIEKTSTNIVSSISGAASSIGKTSANIADNVSGVASSVSGAASNIAGSVDQVFQTINVEGGPANAIQKVSENFNEALDKPEVKAAITKSIENVGEISNIVVGAAAKPIEKVVDVASGAVQKATGSALSGVVKVGTDLMGAVPGAGAIIEAGKMINDSSKAVSAIVEAGSKTVESAADSYIESKENFEKDLKEFNEKKKTGYEISNRTNKSIKDFETPYRQTAGQSVDARKPSRRLLKHTRKTKRVRFAI